VKTLLKSVAAEHSADLDEVDPGLALGAQPLNASAQSQVWGRPGEGVCDRPRMGNYVKAGTRRTDAPVDLVARVIVGWPIAIAVLEGSDGRNLSRPSLLVEEVAHLGDVRRA
jgi:hypothetical protein